MAYWRKQLLQIGWKAALMITGIIDVMATILFLALYKEVEVVPPRVSGDFVFFADAIASSGFFLGPLISVYLIITVHGDVIEGFALFLIIIAISGIINILQNKARLPIEKYKA